MGIFSIDNLLTYVSFKGFNFGFNNLDPLFTRINNLLILYEVEYEKI